MRNRLAILHWRLLFAFGLTFGRVTSKNGVCYIGIFLLHRGERALLADGVKFGFAGLGGLAKLRIQSLLLFLRLDLGQCALPGALPGRELCGANPD